MLINYLLIASLLLTLLAAVALFYRSLRRDMQLLEMKSSFLENAAHTLKTPLARIRLLSEQLQLNWLKNDAQRAAQPGKIMAEIVRMNDLVANLLDFSRIEAGQKNYSFRNMSLAEVAAQAWGELLPVLQESGFTCRCAIDPHLPESAIDARALRLAIGNLVQNAIGYSPECKEIEIKAYRSGDEAVLEIADRGLGIDPAFQRQIFEKFFRIEHDGSHVQGSGLGLFLVRHAVEAHGGRIDLESAAGQGARFIIRLPLIAAAHDAGHGREG
jgi:signal transduction histidine kinase